MNTDRNLLFGVLALQVDYLDAPQFAEACSAWATRKNTPLAELLVERGWISSEQRADVERLLERKLKKNQGDVVKALSVAADASVRDAIREVSHKEFNKTLSQLGPAPGFVEAAPTIDLSPDDRSHYTLTRIHDEGGLGRVWIARDIHLNREVALKEIRTDVKVPAAATRRFVKEAQITGQLEHPNIVPVYELTRAGDQDRPFYTMRFLRGQTFTKAIEDYHRRRRKGLAEPLEMHRLLNAFVNVCNAISFAHSKGIVHRDLKPGNVMLGAFGEVVVLDWGLAKMLDQPEDSNDEEGSIKITDDVVDDATRAGQALGTPAYMAPEQAQGRSDFISPRTDIYGLGAILFKLLCGHSPHKGKSTGEVLSRIIEGPTPRPRDRLGLVSPALDAVCAKAMAMNRSDRYPTAAALAEDVQHWLADEPVSVYRESRGDQLARWMRKHRTGTQAAAVALVIVAAVSWIAAFMINAARQETTEARDQATQLLKEAREAVDVSVTGIAEDLKWLPESQRLRRGLLQRTVDNYQQFAAHRSDDPELQAESGKAYVRLGIVYELLGNYDEAKRAYQSAVDLFEKLAGQFPQVAYRLELAKARNRLGTAADTLGETDAAEAAFRLAISELDDLVGHSDDPLQVRAAKADCYEDIGRLLARRGRAAEAMRWLAQAANTYGELTTEHADPVFLLGLAKTHGTHGQVLSEQGQNAKAVSQLNASIGTFNDLLDGDSDHPDYLEGRAISSINLAQALRALGQVDDERSVYQQAIADYDLLITARPDIAQYHENLATARANYARSLRELGMNQDAIDCADDAIQAFLDLNRLPLPHYSAGMAAAAVTQGRAFMDMNRDQEAEDNLRGSIRLYDGLTIEFAQMPHYRRGLAAARCNYGRFLHKSKKRDAAQDVYQMAIADFQQARSMQAGDDPYSLDGLAWTRMYLGDLFFEFGETAKAHSEYEEARMLWKQLSDEPEYRYQLGLLLANCNDVEIRDLKQAVQHAEELVAKVRDNAKYHSLLGIAYYRADRYSDAIAAFDEAASRYPLENSINSIFLSMALWKNGDVPKALDIYRQAIRCPFAEQNAGNIELNIVRREAELLEIEAAATTSAPKTPTGPGSGP